MSAHAWIVIGLICGIVVMAAIASLAMAWLLKQFFNDCDEIMNHTDQSDTE